MPRRSRRRLTLHIDRLPPMSLAIAAFAPPAPASTTAAPAAPDGNGAAFAQVLSGQTDGTETVAPAVKTTPSPSARRSPAAEEVATTDAAPAAPPPQIAAIAAPAVAVDEPDSDAPGAYLTETEAASPVEAVTADIPQPVVAAPVPSPTAPVPPDAPASQPSLRAEIAATDADPLPAVTPRFDPPASGDLQAAPAPSPTQPFGEAIPAPVTPDSGSPAAPAPQTSSTSADHPASTIPTPTAQVQGPVEHRPDTRSEAPAANAAQPEDASSPSAAASSDAAPKPAPQPTPKDAMQALLGATAGPASPPPADAAPQAPSTDPAAPPQTASAPAPAAGPQTAAPAFPLGMMSTLSQATIETTTRLAAQIAARLEGRSTRFDMVLTPEDLGRVEVSLEIDETGQLAARLAFDNPAAATDLRGRADELRRQLQDAGFQIAGDGLDFSHREDARGGGFGEGFERRGRASLFGSASRLAAEADVVATPPPGAWINLSLARERVDLRV